MPLNGDALTNPGVVRFNLPGEYLLRREESIDRTFFATPLNEVFIEHQDRAHTTAFALGTLVNIDEQEDEKTTFRFKALRQLLGAIADFGLAERLSLEATRLERGKQERLRLGWLRHQVFTSMKRLQDGIEHVKPLIDQQGDQAGYRYLWDQYCSVHTLLEYFTGKPRGSKWPRQPHEMLATLESWSGARTGRQFTVECSGPNPQVSEEDALFWYIVLVNLVHNAVKFAGRGGTVVLRCYPSGSDDSEEWVTVTVENSGEMMSQAFRDYLEGRCEDTPTKRDPPQEGLQTVKHALQEAALPLPEVEAPIVGLNSGTKIMVKFPLRSKNERGPHV
ncbi:MAG: hypothetical protein JRH20_27280 [Deltaproteobacteria bacterium]|nr:hypothetical protein [Deltaproteobacteria bacterium]